MANEKAGSSPGSREGSRPLSPHLQIWRWHVTMLGSILHRMSGVALYAGAVLVVAWIGCLAAGPDAYACFLGLAASPIGLLVWFGLSAAAFYHLASGVRHLVWDLGYGLSPRTASAMATWSIAFAVIATLAFWAWLLVSGKVQL
jgi:succinate dehydrogenase / fumarate reductase cytochrome b subunit